MNLGTIKQYKYIQARSKGIQTKKSLFSFYKKNINIEEINKPTHFWVLTN
jgi:hypothetical protein